MPQFTKQAIIDSFSKLAENTPLDKITVKEITEDCGVTRNTFYYYFRDIYDVIDDIFLTLTADVLKNNQRYPSMADAMLGVNDFVFKHRAAIRNIYFSLGRDKVEQYLLKTTGFAMRNYILSQADDLQVEENDLNLIVATCREAALGLVLNWVRDDIQQDPIERLRRLEFLFKGVIRCSLENAANYPLGNP